MISSPYTTLHNRRHKSAYVDLVYRASPPYIRSHCKGVTPKGFASISKGTMMTEIEFLHPPTKNFRPLLLVFPCRLILARVKTESETEESFFSRYSKGV